MSLIRFKTRVELGFMPGRAGGQSYFRVFKANECVEFSVSETPHGGCTLTAGDGSAAPFVGREYFEVLSEFKSFRFTQDVSLSFASGPYDHLVWEESVRYAQDSVHVFKLEIGRYGDYTLTTPEGRLIPGVCAYLLKEVGPLPSVPPSKRVLDSFPAPVPGIKTPRGAWTCPSILDSLQIIRDGNVPNAICDCPETPVAYLRLVEGDGRRYDKLYYRCSFFGVPKLTKV